MMIRTKRRSPRGTRQLDLFAWTQQVLKTEPPKVFGRTTQPTNTVLISDLLERAITEQKKYGWRMDKPAVERRRKLFAEVERLGQWIADKIEITHANDRRPDEPRARAIFAQEKTTREKDLRFLRDLQLAPAAGYGNYRERNGKVIDAFQKIELMVIIEHTRIINEQTLPICFQHIEEILATRHPIRPSNELVIEEPDGQ